MACSPRSFEPAITTWSESEEAEIELEVDALIPVKALVASFQELPKEQRLERHRDDSRASIMKYNGCQ